MAEYGSEVWDEQPEDEPVDIGATAATPRILLMGARRSGKSSMAGVVFHKMPPHEVRQDTCSQHPPTPPQKHDWFWLPHVAMDSISSRATTVQTCEIYDPLFFRPLARHRV